MKISLFFAFIFITLISFAAPASEAGDFPLSNNQVSTFLPKLLAHGRRVEGNAAQEWKELLGRLNGHDPSVHLLEAACSEYPPIRDVRPEAVIFCVLKIQREISEDELVKFVCSFTTNTLDSFAEITDERLDNVARF